MMRVKVPKEVAEAFDFHHECLNGMSDDEKTLMFMTIPSARVRGKATILRNFAMENPCKYIEALINGYEPEINIQDELSNMITLWLNKPYVGNEQEDIENFAHMVTKLFQQQK